MDWVVRWAAPSGVELKQAAVGVTGWAAPSGVEVKQAAVGVSGGVVGGVVEGGAAPLGCRVRLAAVGECEGSENLEKADLTLDQSVLSGTGIQFIVFRCNIQFEYLME